jgi:glycosyltransferase involved in cell wall biosynthesis
VTVLTAKPNYPQGRIHPGYRGGLWRRREADGGPVIHCALYPCRSKRLLPRLLNYFSFVLSSAVIGSLLLRRADFLLVESPPLFLGLAAWWLSRLKGARLVFNVSDLYPETAVALGYLKSAWLRKRMYDLEAWCYSVATLVTGQTEGIVGSIRSRFPDKPTFLLTNGADLDLFPHPRPAPAAEDRGGGRPFLVGFAGVLGHFQRLATVAQAADLLRGDASVRFVLYGDGPLREELVEQARRLGLTNVQFMGHCPHQEVLRAMRGWDVGLVPLMDTPVMAGALPSKLFEVMASGLPVLLCSPRGEASRLLERAGAGLWVPPETPGALADAVLRLAHDPDLCRRLGQSGREFVRDHYDRAEIARRFLARLEELVGPASRDRRAAAREAAPPDRAPGEPPPFLRPPDSGERRGNVCARSPVTDSQ